LRLTGIEQFNIHILEVCDEHPFSYKRKEVLNSFIGNIQQTRLFSISRNLSAATVVPPIPVMVYKNVGVDVERIILENKGKAGVYC